MNKKIQALIAVMKVRVRCKKADMLLVNYEASDGSKRHNRLWNGGNGEGCKEKREWEYEGSRRNII